MGTPSCELRPLESAVNDPDPVTTVVIEILYHTNPFVPSCAPKTPTPTCVTPPLIWEETAEGEAGLETSDNWVESALSV